MASEQAKWYVIHTYSGYEAMVKDSLEKLIENNNLQENIMDICLYLNAGDEKVLTSAFMSKFTNLDIIKQVYIENGITEIKANALAGMGEGKTIYFYDNSTIATIETGAFGTTKVYVWGPKDSNHAVYKRLKLSEDFATNVLQYNGQ